MQISARDFGYRHASRRKPALSNVNLDVAPGEKILMLGTSGSGKSTLLAAIAGVLGAEDGDSSGHLEVTGTVGMVLQDPDSQVIASRVGDDVAFGCENLNIARDEIWRRVSESLALVGLDLPLDHPTAELSGGQKQRLALAGVLAMGADIIVLDEPTANLDPVGVAEVVAAVDHVARHTNATIIVVEHRVATWQSVVQRCVVLADTDTGSSVLFDAPLNTVVTNHGKELAEAGIWVPGFDPEFPRTAVPPAIVGASTSETALTLTDVVTGWKTPLNSDSPITATIPRGVSTVITGPNGAGKTTLLLSMCGLLPVHSGDIAVAPSIAAPLEPQPIRWSSRELATRMGYVFQDPEHQFVARTVLEELTTSAAVLGADKSEAEEKANEILSRLRLNHLSAANPFTLSGGQKRRLSVATTLVLAPSIVFLDEPTFGQDRTTFIELVQLLRQLTETGTTVVSISHDELFCSAMADNLLHLNPRGSQ
ncbi:MAG: ABC transporter ATP-binding protein [Corynebacterium sp.]|uniref:ABC transporter ATP-binding protein n=1 Tax=Corynebacterium sp. TaxID=1720 RepID=UPI0026DAEA49|nr:ABC transporter ATP-binding protein [Corynebacterium sp.]MDO5097141.1 ABC transporter ATP-binding protein [Corynebacterium sp.]